MEKKQIFGIRKFKTGVASVAIASIMFGVNISNVDAAENVTVSEESVINELVTIPEEIETKPEEVAVMSASPEISDDSEKETIHEVVSNTIITEPVNIIIEDETKDIKIVLEERTEEIDFDTEYVDTPDLYASEEEVKTEGVKGQRTIVEEITYVNGKETNRIEKSNVVTTNPINEIIYRGTYYVEYKNTIEVVSIATDKETYGPEDIITVTLTAKSEGEMKNAILDFLGDSYRSISVNIDTFSLDMDGFYVGKGTTVVPTTTVNGTYTLQAMIAQDMNDNFTSFGMKPESVPSIDLSLEIINAVEKKENTIKVLEVILDKEVYKPNEDINYEVLISSTNQIKNVNLGFRGYGNEFDSPSALHGMPINVFEVDVNGNYIGRGSIPIPLSMISTSFSLSYLHAIDIFDNIVTIAVGPYDDIYPDFEYPYFKIDLSSDIITEVRNEVTNNVLPFEIVYMYNPEMKYGTQNILSEGVNGVLSITEEVTYIDGIEVSRKKLEEVINANPVNRVIEIGIDSLPIQQETRTEEIAFEIKYIDDPELPIGKEIILTKGSIGVVTIIEDVYYLDGEEIYRVINSEEVTTASSAQVISKGTKAINSEDELEDDELPADKEPNETESSNSGDTSLPNPDEVEVDEVEVTQSGVSTLPNTGEKENFALFGLGFLSILTGFGLISSGKKKKSE